MDGIADFRKIAKEIFIQNALEQLVAPDIAMPNTIGELGISVIIMLIAKSVLNFQRLCQRWTLVDVYRYQYRYFHYAKCTAITGLSIWIVLVQMESFDVDYDTSR